MCPGCIATLAIIVGGATSTGGLTALVIRKLRKEKAHESSKNRIAG